MVRRQNDIMSGQLRCKKISKVCKIGEDMCRRDCAGIRGWRGVCLFA